MGILKVLPHYLDEEKAYRRPPLLHRDSYQNKLRNNPQLARSMRYDIHWYGVGEVTLRLELRSNKSGLQPITLEQTQMDSELAQATGLQLRSFKIRILNLVGPIHGGCPCGGGEEMLDQDQSFLW